MKDIALLTEARFSSEAGGGDWYSSQVLAEDRLLAEALARRGYRAVRVDWSAPAVSWGGFVGAVIRATWSYADRLAEFRAALRAIAAETRLVNPPEVVAWNLDKRYLLDLKAGGLATIPTHFVARGTVTTLAVELARFGSAEICIKPVISAGARHTYRVDRDRLASDPQLERTFQTLLEAEDWMVQPFQTSVPLGGELALMVFAGRCTHAVRKRPAQGDFRVQDDFGGSVSPHAPTAAERAFAEAVVACCPVPPSYARVDAVVANDGRLAVMELELIEPELFLRFSELGTDLLADAIISALPAEALS